MRVSLEGGSCVSKLSLVGGESFGLIGGSSGSSLSELFSFGPAIFSDVLVTMVVFSVIIARGIAGLNVVSLVVGGVREFLGLVGLILPCLA